MASIAPALSTSDTVQGPASTLDLKLKLKEQLKLEKRLLIQFQDGSSAIFELATLKSLHFFQVMTEAAFQEALTWLC